jgi:hypothetical protein
MKNEALVTFARVLEGYMQQGPAKLATLWFDKLHIEFGSILDSGRVAVPGGAPGFDEWKRRLILSGDPGLKDDVVETIASNWLSASFSGPAAKDLVPLPDRVSSAIEAVASEEVDARQPGIPSIDDMKESGAARSNLESTFLRWLPVSRDLALLGGGLEMAVLQRVNPTDRTASTHRTFCALLADRIPDFAALTWTEIAELRSHPHYRAFRAKVLELDERIALGELRQAEGLFAHVLHEALVGLAKLVRPNVGWCVVKALIGNLPTGPIPINPADIYFAAKDVAREKRLAEQYGWVYFVIDLDGLLVPSRAKSKTRLRP